jgi:hypothetical protein
MSRILYYTILILLIIQLSMLAQFAGGSGTEADPWLIRTPENLDSLRYYLGADNTDKYFKQIADINLGVAPWNEGAGWEPIGRDSAEFQGNFEGVDENFYIIKLTINDSLKNYASLFGVISNATINDVHIYDCNITGHSGCGPLVGTSFTTVIRNCSATGIVRGSGNEIGGLIGASLEDSITCCYSQVNVSGNYGVGGLAGFTDQNTFVSDCFTTGSVKGNDFLGGFIGANFTETPNKNCYSIGAVSGDFFGVGGFAGSSSSFPINCYWNIETSGMLTSPVGEGRTTEEMIYPLNEYTYGGWDFENTWQIDPLLNGGYPYLKWQNLTGIEDQSSRVPDEFTLFQNYPNPFNPVTKISYSLPQGFSGNVILSIYNANGQLVKELVNDKKSSGIYSVEFNSEGLNSGMYFYRLKTANSDISKKMILLK